MLSKDFFNKAGRISIEMAELLSKTIFTSNDMEDSFNDVFVYERYIFRPTIYEVQTFLRNKYKKHITIYSCSQESWQYRITEPHQKLEDGIFAEDFETYEAALVDALFVILKQIVIN